MKRSVILSLALLGMTCREVHAPDGGRARLVELTAHGLPATVFDSLRVEPPSVVRSALRVGARLELSLDRDAERVVLGAPEACPVPLPPSPVGGAPTRLSLVPLITLSGPESDVGYDTAFEISIRIGCAAVRRGTLEWSLEGEPLGAFSVVDSGYRVVARTTKIPDRLAVWPPGRIVPISPAEQGKTRIIARWTSPAGAVVVRSIRIVAAPRSRGLPNVALGERVLLAGSGFSVLRRPDGAHADPMPWGRGRTPLSSIVPDGAGTWELAHESGRTLTIHASRYDTVLLDCGRTECHAAETHAAQNSPMSAALANLLASPQAPAAIECTFGCHTLGEPGIADGGFSHALSELALDPTRLPAWNQLPRALRRLGGVGCMACHGPAQIPEKAANWGILRAEVCAYCHDAPPRYQHVLAWTTSALAKADQRLETRVSAECARCHTTWGFLEALAGVGRGFRMPPDDEPPLGITCAACHAVHAEDVVRPGLLRRVPTSPAYAGVPAAALERSGGCIFCHEPERAGGPSSALIWVGQGAQDPLSGAPLIGPAPHAAVPGGCVGCHLSGTAQQPGRTGHTFKADPRHCSRCHAARAVDRSIFARAKHLLALGARPAISAFPPHARPSSLTSAHDRALALVRLVIEDRGAAVHNPRYATLLLDRAASVLAEPDLGRP